MNTYSIKVTADNSSAVSQMFDILEESNENGDIDYDFEKVELIEGSKTTVSFEPLERDWQVNLSVVVSAKTDSHAEDKAYKVLNGDSYMSDVEIIDVERWW